jgi:hypothetical protein
MRETVIIQIVYTLILFAGTVAFLGSHVAFIGVMFTSPVLVALVWKPNCGCLQFFSLLFLALMFFLYNAHGSVSTSRGWVLRVFASPSGKSSCTRNPVANLPYNPNGLYDYFDASVVSQPYSFCPYPTMRWADNTETAFSPNTLAALVRPNWTPCTGAECRYASRFREDYQANLGMGLTSWYLGASVADTTLCPNVEYEPNDLGVLGRGQLVCAKCTNMFVLRGVLAPQPQCTDASEHFTCVICPGYSGFEVFSIDGSRNFCTWDLFCFLNVVFWCAVQWFWRPKHKI